MKEVFGEGKDLVSGGEEKRRGKVRKYLEKEMIFLVAEKKKRRRKGRYHFENEN